MRIPSLTTAGPRPIDVFAGGLHLEREGHEVATARDGVQAIDLLAKSDYEVVLLDLMMPGLNGLDVVESLRRDNSPALAHTYLLTASRSKRFEGLPVETA